MAVPSVSAAIDEPSIDNPFAFPDNTRVDRGPALIVGLLMAAYWGRVLRLAWKEKRRTGRAANLFPAEPLGRALRIVWFPAVGLWIALPILLATRALGSLQRLWVFSPVYRQPIVSWVALGLAVAAFVATWVCWRKMGRSWRMGIDPNDRTKLVVTGPYARLRHPIYALSSLLMLCTMMVVPVPAMLLVGVVHLALLQWEARREERYLSDLHGSTYADYAARTGRFLPRF
jgi:protein-S-isoprenylcysteine O-methyltransferase Ste14